MKRTISDDAIESCRRHITATGSRSTEIETFLVRFLLVAIVAEYEEAITGLIARRSERAGDPDLSNFVKSSTGNVFRSLRTGEIGGVLGRFDTDLKRQFMEAVNNTEAQTALDNIVGNRDAFAHGRDVQMTFDELVENYIKSRRVVEEFAGLLGTPLE